MIDGKYSGLIDEYVIVDCRFEYEYLGGHIKGAVNCNTHEELMRKFFNSNEDSTNSTRKAIIFHCEFSSHRGPRM